MQASDNGKHATPWAKAAQKRCIGLQTRVECQLRLSSACLIGVCPLQVDAGRGGCASSASGRRPAVPARIPKVGLVSAKPGSANKCTTSFVFMKPMGLLQMATSVPA